MEVVTNDSVEEQQNKHKKTHVNQQRFINLPNIQLNSLVEIFNTYATRKTFTAGSFNLALIATNFAQLKLLLVPTTGIITWNALNIILLIFICLSLLIQFVIGAGLIFLAKSNEFLDDEKRNQLIKSNNWVTLLVMVVAIINIFINIFLTVI
jgi:nitrogen fixation-related uncharacterized protein